MRGSGIIDLKTKSVFCKSLQEHSSSSALASLPTCRCGCSSIDWMCLSVCSVWVTQDWLWWLWLTLVSSTVCSKAMFLLGNDCHAFFETECVCLTVFILPNQPNSWISLPRRDHDDCDSWLIVLNTDRTLSPFCSRVWQYVNRIELHVWDKSMLGEERDALERCNEADISRPRHGPNVGQLDTRRESIADSQPLVRREMENELLCQGYWSRWTRNKRCRSYFGELFRRIYRSSLPRLRLAIRFISISNSVFNACHPPDWKALRCLE